MASRSNRVAQGYGIALAAVVVAALPAPSHKIAYTAPSAVQTGASVVNSVGKHSALTPHFMSFGVSGDTTVDEIRHRWP